MVWERPFRVLRDDLGNIKMEIESVFKLAVEDYGFKLLINSIEEES